MRMVFFEESRCVWVCVFVNIKKSNLSAKQTRLNVICNKKKKKKKHRVRLRIAKSATFAQFCLVNSFTRNLEEEILRKAKRNVWRVSLCAISICGDSGGGGGARPPLCGGRVLGPEERGVVRPRASLDLRNHLLLREVSGHCHVVRGRRFREDSDDLFPLGKEEWELL